MFALTFSSVCSVDLTSDYYLICRPLEMLEIEEVGIQINWTPDYLKLINLIKVHPVIYNLGDYPKTKADRQNEIYAWENIERIMQCSRACFVFADCICFGFA